MGLPKTDPRMTVDEYLEMERAAEERHVYLDGQVFAMAGESGAHSDISTNVIGMFYNQLRGKRCRSRGSNWFFGMRPVWSRHDCPPYRVPRIGPATGSVLA